ncbi:MAG: TldD/PmbA family protein [Deltaproteobacteria bacterium]|nr:TldD/PmbA family protein [Deltaproteobacteria bacterium]
MVAPGFLAGCGPAASTSVKAPDSIAVTAGQAPEAGHFEMFGIDEAVLRKTLDKAMSRGGGYADLYFEHTVSNYVGLQDGEVNRAYSEIELGCGVRVLKGDQTGFAYTQDLNPASLLAAADTAAVVASGKAAPLMESIVQSTAPSYYKTEVPWSQIGIEQKIPLLELSNKTAMAYDKRIIKVNIFLNDSTSCVLIANSEGSHIEDTRPMVSAWTSCVAEDGERRESNGHSFGQRQGFEMCTEQRMIDLATTAAKRTTVLFEATVPPAGELPVVLSPGLSGILLHEAIGHGMEADFNRKGTSVFADRIGKPIAPEFVTIVDDGTNFSERGSLNIDDEGIESQRTMLVEKGILASYMHDRISAAHYKVKPTGNGRRESYRYPPVPRMRNTYMINGPHKPDEVIKSVKKGIYADTFSNGQVDIGAGDFSFYLKNGYLIEDGKMTRPIKDANLIGFGPKVLENIQMVADDMALFSGTGMCGKDGQSVPVGFGLPTIKCGGISIGGKE